ncbi:MAG: HAMP domain-containing histidine kinase, partial [Candidatus Scalindua sp.]|nr:HAMP domain-containing histidine kinase [Candidatus Scalindua sp.]
DFIHITAHAALDSAIEAARQEQVVSYETKPLDMDHLLAVLKQIMKRKKMEGALLQSEKLKSIGTITAGISHEFNNILAIISGNVQLMKRSYKDQEELVNALDIIMKATNDGAEISKKMYNFAKTEVDTTEYVTNDLSDLIKQSIEFTMPRWKNMAQANGINYHIDIEGIRGISEVPCNSTEIREAFVNIINNALDAMPAGGRISFSTWNKDGSVFVSVSDTGKGMTEDVKRKVFDPFFTTRRPEGTGLGMSIVYSILSRHNGKIEVESEIGNGSTFTLQLPIVSSADSTRAIPGTEQESKSSGHIKSV